MKIRLMGTREECEQVEKTLNAYAEKHDDTVKTLTISGWYDVRNSVNQYRVYIDIELYDKGESKGNETGVNDPLRSRQKRLA